MKDGEKMNICEAVKARTNEYPYIARASWNYPTSVWCNAVIKIMPTNTPDCCIIESITNNTPRPGWMPTAEDLTADDWVLIC